MSNINIVQQDVLEFLRNIPTGTVKMMCTDPPYTDGKDINVLGNHKIQTILDIPAIHKEIERVLQKDAFYVFFGIFPSILTWYQNAENVGLKYAEHIVWAKRMLSAPYHKIVRTHEDIFIFRKGNPKWNETKQDFADIRIPSISLGLVQLQSVLRRLSLLNSVQDAIFLNETIENLKKMFLHEPGKAKNDDFYTNIGDKKKMSNGFSTKVNISNTWAFELTQREFDTVCSFAPQNKTSFGKNGENHKHPTVKPVNLIEQIIKLCTFEEELVVDCFLGSGTTAVACENTNRDFSGCDTFADYVIMSQKKS